MADLKIKNTNVTNYLRTKYKDDNSWITLVKVPPDQHLQVNTEAIKVLANELNHSIVYLTLGKAATDLEKSFREKGINSEKIYYIDAVSQMYGDVKTSNKRMIYVPGPLDIESITSETEKTLASISGKTAVFLDSLTSVVLYNSLPRTLRFSKFLTAFLKKSNAKGVMVSIAKGASTEEIIKSISAECDEILDLT